MTKTLDPDWPVFALSEGESDFDLLYEMEPNTDTAGRQYKMVGQYLENNDFYQGLNKITVIQRLSDDKLFGYSWWDDISKHGDAYIEANGDEYGIEQPKDINSEDFCWEKDYISYYVFEPVETYSITAYRKV